MGYLPVVLTIFLCLTVKIDTNTPLTVLERAGFLAAAYLVSLLIGALLFHFIDFILHLFRR